MAKTGAEVQRERSNQGKCCSCKEPATHGVRCEFHWQKSKEDAKRRYEARKATGLCVMCKTRKVEEGYATCAVCISEQTARKKGIEVVHEQKLVHDKPWHVRNKEAGYCVLGGEKHDRPVGDHTMCESCLAKKRARSEKKIADNVCAQCPKEALPGLRICADCQVANREERLAAKAAGLCPECKKNETNDGKTCEACLADSRRRDKKKRVKLRSAAINAYGGPQCVCCHESNVEFLELDHINNDGNEHRRELFGTNHCGSRFYLKLKQLGYPAGLQVLCSNCNKAKHRCGKCPHEDLPAEQLELLRAFNRDFCKEPNVNRDQQAHQHPQDPACDGQA